MANGLIWTLYWLLWKAVLLVVADEIHWGVDDVTTPAGVLFHYRVLSRPSPTDVNDESCLSESKVVELGQDALPSWMTISYDSESCTEQSDGRRHCDVYVDGVAGPEQVGHQYYISVTHIVTCDDGSSNVYNNDVFTVSVDEADGATATFPPSSPLLTDSARGPLDVEPIQCPVSSSVTLAAVVIDADYSKLEVGERVAIVRRFAEHLRLPVTAIRFLPSSSVVDIDSTVLVAGPGNVKHVKPLWTHLSPTDTSHVTGAAILRWTVGCGNVQSGHMSRLEKLETTAQNGAMSSAIGNWPVIGWHVGNQPAYGGRRRVRRLQPHRLIVSTPVPQPTVAVRPDGAVVRPTVVPDALVMSASTSTRSSQSYPGMHEFQPVNTAPAQSVTTKQKVLRHRDDVTTRRVKLEPSTRERTDAYNGVALKTPPLPATTAKTRATPAPRIYKPKTSSAGRPAVQSKLHTTQAAALVRTTRQSDTIGTSAAVTASVIAVSTADANTVIQHAADVAKTSISNDKLVQLTTTVDTLTSSQVSPVFLSTSVRPIRPKIIKAVTTANGRKAFSKPFSARRVVHTVTSSVADQTTSAFTTAVVATEHQTQQQLSELDLNEVNYKTDYSNSLQHTKLTTSTTADEVTPSLSKQSATSFTNAAVTQSTQFVETTTFRYSTANDVRTAQDTTSSRGDGYQQETLSTNGYPSTADVESLGGVETTTVETTTTTTGPLPLHRPTSNTNRQNIAVSPSTPTSSAMTSSKSALYQTGAAGGLKTTTTVGVPDWSSLTRLPPPTTSTMADFYWWTSAPSEHIRYKYVPAGTSEPYQRRSSKDRNRKLSHRSRGMKKWMMTSITAPPTMLQSRIKPTLVSAVTKHHNYAPIARNQIEQIVHESGRVLTYDIANNTFTDYEDGGTSNLTLILSSGNGMSLPPNSWIKLNATSQSLIALPLDMHVGLHHYMLTAIDRDGKQARMSFEIRIQRRSWGRLMSHEVSIVLDLDYQMFVQLVQKRIDVASKIGSVLGDRDPVQHIVVSRISPGSVIYTWTNSSILAKRGNDCPVKEIEALARRIVDNESFVRQMRPYFVLSSAVVPHGVCRSVFQQYQTVAATGRPPSSPASKVDKVGSRPGPSPPGPVVQIQSRPKGPYDASAADSNGLLYVLIPLVVLAVVLVCILIAVCCRELSHRSTIAKNRHAKLPSSSSTSSGLSTVNHRCTGRGIPVIFADELADVINGHGAKRANGNGVADDYDGGDIKSSAALPPPKYRGLMSNATLASGTGSGRVSSDRVTEVKSLLVSDDETDDDDLLQQQQHGQSHQIPGCGSLEKYRINRPSPSWTKPADDSRGGGLNLPSSGHPMFYNGSTPPPPYGRHNMMYEL